MSQDVLSQKITTEFNKMFDGLDDNNRLLEKKPLLAHYTSIQTLEKIMTNDEIWLSNPLFMNDLQEMRFGVSQGLEIFERSIEVNKAVGSPDRAKKLKDYYWQYHDAFAERHALDVYVFCLSEHNPKNVDGLLSMWRGYGGQGTGASLIFNTRFFTESPESPLLLIKVRYGTTRQREMVLKRKITEFCEILRRVNVPDEFLYIPAWVFFGIVKFFALSYKHQGFREEQEWRVIYMTERDAAGILKDGLFYSIGGRGVEPKFKLRLRPLDIEGGGEWKFEDILEKILLGPGASSPLAQLSVKRMLETLGKSSFCSKVAGSAIPFRTSWTNFIN